MDIWVIGTLNQLFIIFKKINKLLAKICSLWQVQFAVTILFLLTLASDMAALFENDVFSILVLPTKTRFSSFLKKVFVFLKICCKVTLSLIVTQKYVELSNRGYFENP